MKWILAFICCLTINAHAAFLEKSIDISANGPTLVIPAVVGQKITVYGILLTSSLDSTFYFSNGTTALTGPMTIFSGGSWGPVRDNFPWFTLYTGLGLYLTQTGSSQLSGRIYYQQAP